MDLDPVTKTQVNIKLYQNIKNVKNLRQKLMNGELKCCMIKPTLIYDPFQIVVATNKALTNSLITKSVFTEILFNLSPSKHISGCLKAFGIDDNDKNLIVVTLSNSEDSSDNIYNQIEGEEIPLSELKNFSDLNKIRKEYKINERESATIPTLDSVISRIAAKNCT